MVDKPRAATAKSQTEDDPEHGGAVYCLSYVSTQAQPMTNDELVALLKHAREKNARLGITGLLMHRGDSFFQILEGGEEEVLGLYEDICNDDRHLRIETVAEGRVHAREFSDWQMAFIELDDQDFSALPGFSDLLKSTRKSRDFLHSLSRSKKLALLFSIIE